MSPKFKVIGHDCTRRSISSDWIEADTIQEAYEKYCKAHPETEVCYVIDKQGEGNVNKISKENNQVMSTEETANTTKITVAPKTMDKEGNITTIKEGTMSEKEVTKKAPAKSDQKSGKPVSKPAKAVKVEQKAKATGKAVKSAKAPASKASSKAKVAPVKAKAIKSTVKKDVVKRTGEISATTHQAGIGDMKLDSVAATKEATKKAVEALRAKGKVVRVLVRQGKFAVYYKP